MTTPHDLPEDHHHIKRVGSFEELVSTPFVEGVNALCWERTLVGDFAEVLEGLLTHVGEGITPLEDEQLLQLSLSPAGRLAVEVMLGDLRRLRDLGLLPELNVVNGYVEREQEGPVRTDVRSFHVDSATVETDTWLCTYHGACSEGLRQEDAVPRVEVPETRAALREYFIQEGGDGDDETEFAEFLSECCYDLHYVPVPEARPFSFGVGNLWRVATLWPGAKVPPCVHRAPDPATGDTARLLLIS